MALTSSLLILILNIFINVAVVIAAAAAAAETFPMLLYSGPYSKLVKLSNGRWWHVLGCIDECACVCVWVPSEYVCSDVDSFSVYCSILNQRIYFELCLCYHAYVTSTRIISTRLKLSFSLLPIVPAATAAAASTLQTQLLYGQTIQSIQFMFNIWRVMKNKKNKQECLAIWMCVGFTSNVLYW